MSFILMLIFVKVSPSRSFSPTVVEKNQQSIFALTREIGLLLPSVKVPSMILSTVILFIMAVDALLFVRTTTASMSETSISSYSRAIRHKNTSYSSENFVKNHQIVNSMLLFDIQFIDEIL